MTILPMCKAIAVGRTSAQTAFMQGVAHKCGFGLVEDTSHDIPSPDARIAFFLAHYQMGDDLLGKLVQQVRQAPGQTRFSPVILFSDDCSFEQVIKYVHLGFDDVLSLPDKKEMLIQRLNNQLLRQIMYVETADYFGPDRRRLEVDGYSHQRRLGLGGHARYYFRRLPDAGVQIEKHQIFPALHFEAPLRRVG